MRIKCYKVKNGMKENIKPINYYQGIFDKYKDNDDLDSWMDFPDLMWGLGFDINFEVPFEEYVKTLNIKIKEPKNERENKRNILYILEHSDRQIVGNYLFAYWRFLTHWTFYGYTDYDVDFIKRIIKILEDSYQ